ncbi:sugar O-acetyltransferase [Streptomyces sp. CA2R106]|uniref:sugar O-acetyltransferase n=1 Tax=Streptomyces sp. CA2R106 TaxID=3120153 RepID=UPI00300BDAD7
MPTLVRAPGRGGQDQETLMEERMAQLEDDRARDRTVGQPDVPGAAPAGPTADTQTHADTHAEARDRITHGLLYNESDAGFLQGGRRAGLLHEYNQTAPAEAERRAVLLGRILGSIGKRSFIAPVFQAAYGSNVHIGDDFYGNFNLSLIDDVEIRIGNGVMIAPNTTITTTGHPVHPELRVDYNRFSEPVAIGDKVWIGSNVVVLPGVTIGYGSVIGAGSVVTHDIPPMVVAFGAPCRIVRPITDADLTQRQ